MLKNKFLQYIFIVSVSIALLLILKNCSNQYDLSLANAASPHQAAYEAEILSIIDDNYDEIAYDGFESGTQIILFEIEVLDGYKKGTTSEMVQYISDVYNGNVVAGEVGDKVIIVENIDPSTPEVEYMHAEFSRFNSLLLLAGVFSILIILFGRMKGANTIISLGLTVLAVFWVFIPAALNGANIYLWTIIIAIYIIFMTLTIINGFSLKSLTSIIGCSSGVFISGIITVVFTDILNITGLVDQDSLYLNSLSPENPIDLRAVVFAMITIGAIGAIMDVSVSLASSLHELKETAPHLKANEITKSGFVIGRDILGTMANTLILAYIGSSLTLTMLLFASTNPTDFTFNTELVTTELLQALAGSFGILLSIPLTSIVCGILYANIKPKPKTIDRLEYAKEE